MLNIEQAVASMNAHDYMLYGLALVTGCGIAAAGLAVMSSIPFHRWMGDHRRAHFDGAWLHQPESVRRHLLSRMTGQVSRFSWLASWESIAAPRLRQVGWRWSPRLFMGVRLLVAMSGIAAGLMLKMKLILTVLLILVALWLPEAILERLLDQRRRRREQQLGGAVNLFVVEFHDTPNVSRALEITAKRLQEPLGPELLMSSSQLQAGRHPDEVFAQLAKCLDVPYGRLFAQLLRAACNDAGVGTLFARLSSRIVAQQQMTRKNAAELARLRMTGFLLNLLLVPAFLMSKSLFSESFQFLAHHPLGKALIATGFSSLALGLFLDRTMHQVDG